MPNLAVGNLSRLGRRLALGCGVVLVACCAHLAAAQTVAEPSHESGRPPTTKPFLLGPPKVDGPVMVHASFHLLNISAIHDEAEAVEFSGVLQLVWQDARQTFDAAREGVSEKVYSGGYQFDEISPGWYPQVTLLNAAGQYESRAVILRVKPDGTSTLIEAVDAVAKVNLQMQRYPFDRQRLELVFDVLGFNAGEVALVATPTSASAPNRTIMVPQWTMKGVEGSISNMDVALAGAVNLRSAFVVTIDMKRKSFFMVRLVLIPLFLIVMLSWSVFWMERSSLGDRMSVSFVGILTAVAYQIMLGGILPHVSYFTFMHGFLNVSMLVMTATVGINLIGGAADKQGDLQRGDWIDRRCRWIFPLTYTGMIGLMLVWAFLF
ncbi:hypothetical protein [uncultured Nitrospira sp.]|uniref:hypothetical protein n=1 Tax=uncultured Nitrospira sp. TaxID=157176 RepID=UPI0031407DFB